MTQNIVAFLALIAMGCNAADRQSDEAAALVADFYRKHIPVASSGLPNETEIEAMRPFVSTNLYAWFAQALSARQEWARANPDDPSRGIVNKPPCAEGGDYFDSLTEWPDVQPKADGVGGQHFQILKTENQERDTWHVRVRFWYETTPVVEWADTVLVVRRDGRLAIDDVIYAGVGNFNRGGRLSELLQGCTKQFRILRRHAA